MRLILPCATVLRKILPYSIPGSRRLCTYSARPVTFSQDSRRGTERPTCGVSVDCVARFMDRPPEVNADQLLLVRRRAVQVAFDVRLLGGGLARLLYCLRIRNPPAEDLFCSCEARRAIGGCGYEHARLVAVEHHRHAERGPVVGRARRALEVSGAPPAERGHLQRGDELASLQGVLQVAGIERLHRQAALACRP